MTETRSLTAQRVAVLGTSPLMIILADHLARTRSVTIFEERSVLGGAWSQVSVSGHQISSKTNILVPLEAAEEPVMGQINDLLRSRFGVDAVQSPDRISMLSGYSPQNRFHYDLRPLFASLEGADNVVTSRIDRVKVADGIVVAGSRSFERLFLPYFGGIEAIELDGKEIPTPYSEIVSEHLLLIMGGRVEGGALYCENFNDIFDRVQIRSQTDRVVFTGRVGRAHKGKSLDWLVANAIALFPGNRILHATIDKYRNYYRNEDQLGVLRRAVGAAGPQLQLVTTSQFVAGFKELLPLLQDEVGHD